MRNRMLLVVASCSLLACSSDLPAADRSSVVGMAMDAANKQVQEYRSTGKFSTFLKASFRCYEVRTVFREKEGVIINYVVSVNNGGLTIDPDYCITPGEHNFVNAIFIQPTKLIEIICPAQIGLLDDNELPTLKNGQPLCQATKFHEKIDSKTGFYKSYATKVSLKPTSIKEWSLKQ